jgi:hypothetical protein
MNIEILANYADVVGGTAVLISLLYVGFQVRSNTRSSLSGYLTTSLLETVAIVLPSRGITIPMPQQELSPAGRDEHPPIPIKYQRRTRATTRSGLIGRSEEG